MKYIYLTPAFFLLLSFSTYAQVVFQKTYGGIDNDVAQDIAIASDGSIYMTGRTEIPGNFEIAVFKLNPAGETIWGRTYGTNWDDSGVKITELADGTLLIAGVTKAHAEYWYINYMIRISTQGDVIWSQIFGGNHWDQAYAKPLQDSTGDIYILGTTQSFGSGAKDINLTKMDLLGNVIWSKYFGMGMDINDWGYGLDLMEDGTLMITARINHTSNSSESAFILVDTDGEILSTRSFYSNHPCFFRTSAFIGNSEIVCVGRIMDLNSGIEDALVVRIVDFEVQWAKRFGTSGYTYATSVSPGTNGISLAGHTIGNGTQQEDNIMVTLDNDGEFLWGKRYGSALNDAGTSGTDLIRTADGYYVFSGTYSFGAGEQDFYLIKTDLEGNSNCNEYDFSPEMTDVTFNEYSPSLISGYIFNYNIEPTVNTFQPTVGILCEDTLTMYRNEIPQQSSDFTLFPNPSHQQVSVWFGMEIHQGSLIVSDAAGHEIKKFPLSNQRKMQLQIGELKDGMYVITIQDFNTNQKRTLKFLKD
jgi:hypothetical protein